MGEKFVVFLICGLLFPDWRASCGDDLLRGKGEVGSVFFFLSILQYLILVISAERAVDRAEPKDPDSTNQDIQKKAKVDEA